MSTPPSPKEKESSNSSANYPQLENNPEWKWSIDTTISAGAGLIALAGFVLWTLPPNKFWTIIYENRWETYGWPLGALFEDFG